MASEKLKSLKVQDGPEGSWSSGPRTEGFVPGTKWTEGTGSLNTARWGFSESL